MKATILGTGNAMVTACYNTCFVLSDGNRHLLVDGGGGSEIFVRLKRAAISVNEIHEIYVTHKHMDHLMGIIWMMRAVAQNMNKGTYEGELTIFSHAEVIGILIAMTNLIMNPGETKHLGERIHMQIVEDRETRTMLGRPATFFDIHSTKATQFGFKLMLNDKDALICAGDEPLPESCYDVARGAAWLMHEAFCLKSEAEKYKPYEKHHSTVADACDMAESLGVKNLVLYHTEDHLIACRKERYLSEGEDHFSGRLFVPDDMEIIDLDTKRM